MSLAYKISAANRWRKWNLFLREIAPTERTRILDVGYSENELSDTDNFLEKHHPYPENLTALGIDLPTQFRQRYPKVNVVQYPGGRFPFADQAFDLCWSNAVIEHVGDRPKQLGFLREIKRLSRRAFITTPNRFFPIEVHTRTPLLHYLPKRIFERYLAWVGKAWATGDYMYLLSLGELKALLSRAGISDYKIFRNRLAGFTMDYVVIFACG
jgi:SAM-dependent methyltransferase